LTAVFLLGTQFLQTEFKQTRSAAVFDQAHGINNQQAAQKKAQHHDDGEKSTVVDIGASGEIQ
jgi:hypothetical protein